MTKPKSRRSPVYYLLLLILLGVFGVSAYKVGSYVLDSVKQKQTYDELAQMVAQVQSTKPTAPAKEETAPPSATEIPSGAAETAAPTEAPLPVLPEYEALLAMNPDLVGWVKIPQTAINYPVMQTPMTPEYYLYRNFYKERSDRGCIFAQSTCDIDAPSDNVTIYGHCMKDGSMFAGLANYTYQSYWKDHPAVQFDSLYESRSYRVFAVFKTSANPGEGFAYHTFVDAASPADFTSFVSQCKELAFYDTGITPEYGDKLLCLSTCEYTMANGRLVVACVLEEAEAVSQ